MLPGASWPTTACAFASLALLLSGCDLLFQLDHIGVDAAFNTDSRTDAEPDAGPLEQWAVPMLIPGPASVGSDETDASMTEDLLEIYFSSDRPGGAGNHDIWRSTRTTTSAAFQDVERVAELSGTEDDKGFVSANGLTFYIVRSTGVMVASRLTRMNQFGELIGDSWLSALPNASNVEVSADGLQANATAPVGMDTDELFLFNRAAVTDPWSPPAHASGLGTSLLDGGGTFDRHGTTIIFHSNRASPVLHAYIATRPSVVMQFDAPTAINELDDGEVSDPWVSPDLRTIVFNRDGELYMSTR